jgi:hypothetical protein
MLRSGFGVSITCVGVYVRGLRYLRLALNLSQFGRWYSESIVQDSMNGEGVWGSFIFEM